MPNTKSAERRVRSSERERVRNSSTKSKVKTLEKGYLASLKTGKKDAAVVALRNVVAAMDKAAKKGVLKKGTVNRKKSRLAIKLNKIAAAA
jgi:small subunit ribosomal protein S20